MADKPQIIEVNVSVSRGGKVTIVKFDLSQDYHFSMSEKHAVPEGWSEEQVDAYRHTVFDRLNRAIENLAQAEVDSLLDESQVF